MKIHVLCSMLLSIKQIKSEKSVGNFFFSVCNAKISLVKLLSSTDGAVITKQPIGGLGEKVVNQSSGIVSNLIIFRVSLNTILSKHFTYICRTVS